MSEYTSASAFADAVQRARQIAAKIHSGVDTTGTKRPMEEVGATLGLPEAKKLAVSDDGKSITQQLTALQAQRSIGAIANAITVEEWKVPDKMVGLIIGRGGEQITRLQAESGCKVQMAADSGGLPERICTLTGSRQSIDKAKELISAIINRGGPPLPVLDTNHVPDGHTIVEMMIPGPKVGLVIGKGGETIRNLQERAAVKMVLIQEGPQQTSQEKPLRITGEPDKCESIQRGGFDGTNEYGSAAGTQARPGNTHEIMVPKQAVGVVIGKGSDMIKKIQQDSGARVQFLNVKEEGPEDKVCVVTGTPEQIQAASLFINDLIQSVLASQDYGDISHYKEHNLQTMLDHEKDKRMRLESLIKELAEQNAIIETSAKEASTIPTKVCRQTSSGCSSQSGSASSATDDVDEDGANYEDMMEVEDFGRQYIVKPNRKVIYQKPVILSTGLVQQFILASTETNNPDSDGKSMKDFLDMVKELEHKSICLDEILKGSDHSDGSSSDFEDKSNFLTSTRRKTVPEQLRNHCLNLWSVLKESIGEDLTKISMPVNFNEPLSTLQRLTEEYEYSELLDKAAECTDSCEQMTYVAAFAVSAYASTNNRTGKPFSPCLGETYECDRSNDYGWRCFSEQVSHNPPMLAQHCEGRGWKRWQEVTITSNFYGNNLQIMPLGVAYLLFPTSGNYYTWRKVITSVHNIIVGQLWVDNHGEMEIVNHITEDKCHLRFIPYSYFSREVPRKVTGIISDNKENAKFVVQGSWDNKVESSSVLSSQGSVNGKTLLEISMPKTIWRRNRPGSDYEKMYNFTVLACQLNEPEDGVAPTDSRNRPDQRLMEDGAWDEANQIKLELEEKQRTVQKKREEEAERAATEGISYQGYTPVWFRKETDAITGYPVHAYIGGYWESKETQDWSNCPNIFM